MVMKTHLRTPFGLLTLLTFAPVVMAERVTCHITYGGETRHIAAAPVASPYALAPTSIGSYFLFRIVFQDKPADLGSIKVYTYADRDSGPQIIHQASYPYPLQNATVYGFSGQQFVYEPVRDGELQYWCELDAQRVSK